MSIYAAAAFSQVATTSMTFTGGVKGTVTSATTTVVTDSTLAMTVNEFVDCCILIYSGTGIGHLRWITANDATSFTIEAALPFYIAPVAGDLYIVGCSRRYLKTKDTAADMLVQGDTEPKQYYSKVNINIGNATNFGYMVDGGGSFKLNLDKILTCEQASTNNSEIWFGGLDSNNVPIVLTDFIGSKTTSADIITIKQGDSGKLGGKLYFYGGQLQTLIYPGFRGRITLQGVVTNVGTGRNSFGDMRFLYLTFADMEFNTENLRIENFRMYTRRGRKLLVGVPPNKVWDNVEVSNAYPTPDITGAGVYKNIGDEGALWLGSTYGGSPIINRNYKSLGGNKWDVIVYTAWAPNYAILIDPQVAQSKVVVSEVYLFEVSPANYLEIKKSFYDKIVDNSSSANALNGASYDLYNKNGTLYSLVSCETGEVGEYIGTVGSATANTIVITGNVLSGKDFRSRKLKIITVGKVQTMYIQSHSYSAPDTTITLTENFTGTIVAGDRFYIEGLLLVAKFTTMLFGIKSDATALTFTPSASDDSFRRLVLIITSKTSESVIRLSGKVSGVDTIEDITINATYTFISTKNWDVLSMTAQRQSGVCTYEVWQSIYTNYSPFAQKIRYTGLKEYERNISFDPFDGNEYIGLKELQPYVNITDGVAG